MLRDWEWNLFMKLKEIKKRYCECGRELEYRCRVCSECRQINIELSQDIYRASAKCKAREKELRYLKYKRKGLKTLQNRKRWAYKETI